MLAIKNLFFIAIMFLILLSTPCNAAVNFDGADDRITLPNTVATSLSSGTEVTFSAWFKGSSAQSCIRIQPGGWIILVWFDQAYISTDGVLNYGGINYKDGNWHLLTMTWKKNTTNGFKTFVDGMIANQRDSINVNLPVLAAGAQLGAVNTSELTNGELDDARIYNRALSVTEVELLYKAKRKRIGGSLAQGLVAHYEMSEEELGTAVTTLIDASGNSNHGTGIGGASLQFTASPINRN